MKYINFGGRYDSGKLEFFGVDEVNAELANGGRIEKLIPQGAIVTKFDDKQWALSGYTIIAEIAESGDRPPATHQ